MKLQQKKKYIYIYNNFVVVCHKNSQLIGAVFSINYKKYFIKHYQNLGSQSSLKIFHQAHMEASEIKLYLKVLKC